MQLRDPLPHAILIRSEEGHGEYEFGFAAAQSLLCENPDSRGRGCGKCLACGWLEQGNHPDFRLLVPESLAPESVVEGAEPPRREKPSEQIRIEQVRDLSGFLTVGTHRAGPRVILAYPAEAMNPNTQNALLKSLEEPPSGTVFLLVSTRQEGLLATVRSRCVKFDLPPAGESQALAWLKQQGVKRPETALAAAGGAPLKALREAEAAPDRSRFLEGLRARDFDAIALAEMAQRVPAGEIVGWLQRWSHDLLLARVSGRVRYYPDHEGAIADLSRASEPAEIAAYLRRLAEAAALARHPLNARLFVEDLLLRYQRLVLAVPGRSEAGG